MQGDGDGVAGGDRGEGARSAAGDGHSGLLWVKSPRPGDVLSGLVPRFDGSGSVLLAVGILGATIMPHVIYLHSALTQRRVPVVAPSAKRRLFRFEMVDVVIAMTIAGLVNVAMLVIAATVFNGAGLTSAGDDLTRAYDALGTVVGGHADILFGVALLASGPVAQPELRIGTMWNKQPEALCAGYVVQGEGAIAAGTSELSMKTQLPVKPGTAVCVGASRVLWSLTAKGVYDSLHIGSCKETASKAGTEVVCPLTGVGFHFGVDGLVQSVYAVPLEKKP
mgnify:CR=1 FL=1